MRLVYHFVIETLQNVREKLNQLQNMHEQLIQINIRLAQLAWLKTTSKWKRKFYKNGKVLISDIQAIW